MLPRQSTSSGRLPRRVMMGSHVQHISRPPRFTPGLQMARHGLRQDPPRGPGPSIHAQGLRGVAEKAEDGVPGLHAAAWPRSESLRDLFSTPLEGGAQQPRKPSHPTGFWTANCPSESPFQAFFSGAGLSQFVLRKAPMCACPEIPLVAVEETPNESHPFLQLPEQNLAAPSYMLPQFGKAKKGHGNQHVQGLHGYGSKLNHQGTAGFSPWFHLPGQAILGLPYL